MKGMTVWALIFIVMSALSVWLGLVGNLTGTAAIIDEMIFGVFLALAVVSFILGRRAD